MSSIKLQSSDDKIFKVDVEVAKCFVAIKDMLESLAIEDNEVCIIMVENNLIR